MKNFGWNVFGVEPDPQAAETAKKMVQSDRILTGTIEQAEFKDNWFDAITLTHVIEHLQDPIETLKECRRILRPGGQLIVATPNAESLGNKWLKQNWRGWEPPRHLYLLNGETLQQCATRAGFSDCIVKRNAAIAYDIWLFGNKLKNNSNFPINATTFPSKFITIKALGFWLFEYAMNLLWPCGDELVLFARKK